MNSEEIITAVQVEIPGSQVQVKLEGNNAHILVVSDFFVGLKPVRKQQKVYAALNEHIASGVLHAVTMETHTLAEWEKIKLFQPASLG